MRERAGRVAIAAGDNRGIGPAILRVLAHAGAAEIPGAATALPRVGQRGMFRAGAGHPPGDGSVMQ